MKYCPMVLAALLTIFGCQEKQATTVVNEIPSVFGTWQLVSAKIITKSDTAVTFPVKNQEMIKIFNTGHFAFFKHNINRLPGDSSVFDAGSGTYTLNGDDYTEKLQYCTARDWEDHEFKFKLKVKNDTLIQTGVEKIDSLNIDQEIVEVYVKKR